MIGALMHAIGSRAIAAGIKPVQWNGKSRNVHRSVVHDVSILVGVGFHLGSQPRANTSMTIMRAPQRGHGHGSTRGASGAASGCSCWSAKGRGRIAVVQVFGRRNNETLRSRRWPASKKRQGTKSREVGQRLCSERLWGFDISADLKLRAQR